MFLGNCRGSVSVCVCIYMCVSISVLASAQSAYIYIDIYLLPFLVEVFLLLALACCFLALEEKPFTGWLPLLSFFNPWTILMSLVEDTFESGGVSLYGRERRRTTETKRGFWRLEGRRVASAGCSSGSRLAACVYVCIWCM